MEILIYQRFYCVLLAVNVSCISLRILYVHTKGDSRRDLGREGKYTMFWTVAYECTDPQVDEASLPTLVLHTAIDTQEVHTASVVETLLFGNFFSSLLSDFQCEICNKRKFHKIK